MTGLLGKVLDLVVNEFIIYLDVVVVHFVFRSEFNFEFRCQSNVKDEFEIVCIFNVLGLLLFRHHGFAKDIQLIFLNIVHQFFTQDLVHLVGFHLHAETLLNE